MNFKKELEYQKTDLSSGKLETKTVCKIATFKELSLTDVSQRELLFEGRPLFTSFKSINKKKANLIVEPKFAAQFAETIIDTLLIIDDDSVIDGFHEVDKKEFMFDNMAVMIFTEWFIEKKFASFFFDSIARYPQYLKSLNPKGTS
jgi:hypothetical protein